MDVDAAAMAQLPAASDYIAPQALVAQSAPNPDAQATVSDFLDYTEYLPSDLTRSMRLIEDLDRAYKEATALADRHAVLLGHRDKMPANERPDATKLRRDLAAALDKAEYCRRSSDAEAKRLCEVAHRHAARLDIITAKLKALPEPPSRDPSPEPAPALSSPQQSRDILSGSPRALQANAARQLQRDRNRKSRVVEDDSSDGDSDPDLREALHPGSTRGIKRKDKTPRPPRPPRPRPSGAIATISTSTALARLTPPPANAKPGSKWAPWFQLTEYEMASLRKSMKKNAMWTPSETMMKRELDRKGRGQAAYDAEKARCEAAGEELIDEEPYTHSAMRAASETAVPLDDGETQGTSRRNSIKDDTTMANKGVKITEAKKNKREIEREQAQRDAEELEQVSRRIKQAAETLQQLNFPTDTVVEGRKPSGLKKRKRESSLTTVETSTGVTREPSHVSQDSGTVAPEPKRPRLTLTQNAGTSVAASSVSPRNTVAAPPARSMSRISSPATSSPVSHTQVPLPSASPNVATSASPNVASSSALPTVTTTKIPLASPGPSTPRVSEAPTSRPPSRQSTPQATPAPPSPQPTKKASPPPTPAPPTITAASTRPRRESVAPPKAASPPAVPAMVSEPAEGRKTPSPQPEPEQAQVEEQEVPAEQAEQEEQPGIAPYQEQEPENESAPEPGPEPEQESQQSKPEPAVEPVLEPVSEPLSEPLSEPRSVEPQPEPEEQPEQVVEESIQEHQPDEEPDHMLEPEAAPPEHEAQHVAEVEHAPKLEPEPHVEQAEPELEKAELEPEPQAQPEPEPLPESQAVEPEQEPEPEPRRLRSSPTAPPVPAAPAAPVAPVAPTPRLRSTRSAAALQPNPEQDVVLPDAPELAQAEPTPEVVEEAKETKAKTRSHNRHSPLAELPTRARSTRNSVATPKAQSEEPSLKTAVGKSTRDLRRHSVVTQAPAAPAAPVPAPVATRSSMRKKPQPTGDVTSNENGQTTVTHTRANGRKNKKQAAVKDKKEKADDNMTEPDDIDPNEPRYCVCDDVAYGSMIQCDNDPECDKEWFHFECLGMTKKDLPNRREKWYCPACREKKGTDAKGHPIIAPTLPGRSTRGNR